VLNSLKDKIWYEKYRPSNISEYVFQSNEHKKAICSYIEKQDIPHLLLSGGPGGGKTTLVRVLINELHVDPIDVLVVNASDENSVDVIREKIKGFITSFAVGSFKLVHLEEADRITPSAQDALKAMMEDYADVARFILTCNAENKITPPIRSRCTHFRFKSVDKVDLALYLVNILKKEKVKCDIDTLDQYIDAAYPDIRKTINLIQQHSAHGILEPFNGNSKEVGEYVDELLDAINEDRWEAARSITTHHVSGEDWDSFYRVLYEQIDKCGKFKEKAKWEAAIVTISEHLYRDSHVADREINAIAMLIKLSHI